MTDKIKITLRLSINQKFQLKTNFSFQLKGKKLQIILFLNGIYVTVCCVMWLAFWPISTGFEMKKPK